MSKLVHKFHIEAIWDTEKDKFVEFKTYEVIGEVSRLAGLIGSAVRKEKVIVKILEKAVENAKMLDKNPEVKEVKSSLVNNILKMTDEELMKAARLRGNDA